MQTSSELLEYGGLFVGSLGASANIDIHFDTAVINDDCDSQSSLTAICAEGVSDVLTRSDDITVICAEVWLTRDDISVIYAEV